MFQGNLSHMSAQSLRVMGTHSLLSLRLVAVMSLLYLEMVQSFVVVTDKSVFRSRHRTLSSTSSGDQNINITQTSRLTDWVIENLEDNTSKITTSSPTKAGENDTIPTQGLCMAGLHIMAAESLSINDSKYDQYIPVRLLLGRNGWGTGVHPTTRLCLEWLSTTLKGGELVLDYGCGSGILSIAALLYGASKCIGVDIEAEALVTAERNIELNGLDSESRFEGLHTRQVVPYEFQADVCVANILIGQLVRPSMVSALVTNTAPGGLLCLSGIRPSQVDSLKTAYQPYVEEWISYDEQTAADTEGSLDSYGFDVGRWSRLVGRIRISSDRMSDIASMSELAVS